ncbi:LuxR C-terminal-related transcriptional regulator [Sulfurimonas sp.]|uniref:response regulator transcription factor n=1 Tax=Sulfurimonas sp. TaxID=2022749 RepID=UPI001A06E436|nr:LuxR C-terminal-related transcriptional regulator [Sulfurimonas sp.]MBE0515001.1 response regulator transcription factor [Sulfurimonas sp.]MBE0515075.1 response regulator transcription factor [Sulfurimonas sp.]
MKKVIIFTNMSSIKRHWQSALNNSYETVSIEDFDELLKYLAKYGDRISVMIDEMSIQNIEYALKKLKEHPNAVTLLFNSVPEVYHASTLLGSGIKGYENSYINKENLLNMLSSVEYGNNWLFADLTYFIINKYMQNKRKDEPEFISLLTEKEKDIALMIAEGLNNKEIAQREKIALSTVKGHIHHIFEKANVTDRISLALKFK